MTIHTIRRAVTLVEVLIAIFLMGIGLMAILSLFPLGASQMAQALQDQRAAEAATTAGALSRTIWKIACDGDEAAGDTGALRFADNNPSSYLEYNQNSPYKNTPHQSMTALAPQSVQRFLMAMDDPQWNPPAQAKPQYTMYGQPGITSATQTVVPGSDANNGPQSLPMTGAPAWGTPSYPVLVDPIGWQANQATTDNGQWWVG